MDMGVGHEGQHIRTGMRMSDRRAARAMRRSGGLLLVVEPVARCAASSRARGRASAACRARRAGRCAGRGRCATRPRPTPGRRRPGGGASRSASARCDVVAAGAPPRWTQRSSRGGQVDGISSSASATSTTATTLPTVGALEDRRDRGQRGLVAAQQQPVDVLARREVHARPGVADARAERHVGRPRAGGPGGSCSTTSTSISPRSAAVAADRVVAPLLRRRAGRERPAAAREHDRLAGRDEQQRDDLAGLLDRPVFAEAIAAQRHADHPRREHLAGHERRDARAAGKRSRAAMLGHPNTRPPWVGIPATVPPLPDLGNPKLDSRVRHHDRSRPT